MCRGTPIRLALRQRLVAGFAYAAGDAEAPIGRFAILFGIQPDTSFDASTGFIDAPCRTAATDDAVAISSARDRLELFVRELDRFLAGGLRERLQVFGGDVEALPLQKLDNGLGALGCIEPLDEALVLRCDDDANSRRAEAVIAVAFVALNTG